MTLYIDTSKRKELVARWIPVSLLLLHVWASLLVIAALLGAENEILGGMFSTCCWGVAGLVLLLVSDRAIDIFLARASALSDAHTVEKTTTEKTVVTPMPEMELKSE